MLQMVFLEKLNGNMFINIALIAITEFLATMFSKVILMHLNRKIAMIVSDGFIAVAFLFLIIFPKNIQCEYAVTLITRAALSILFNILQISTFEQFPTEVRAFSTGLCISFGLLSGVGLPFINSLS
jgi:hypothetical protein